MEISTEKKKLISEIKEKIAELEITNDDMWTSAKCASINNLAIAKHYETLEKLLK